MKYEKGLHKPTEQRSSKPELRIAQERIDQGSEMVVHRSELYYGRYQKTVDGFVLKEINGSDPTYQKHQLQDVLRQWRYIIDVNRHRKQEGKTTMNLPGTVRGWDANGKVGIIMTDLSENGAKKVTDLKELQFSFLSREKWAQIKEQVLRDIKIAEEEHIQLNSGPKEVDPWLVVHESNKTAVVYLSDIGGYTSVGVHHRTVQSTQKIVAALEKIEEGLEKQWRMLESHV